MSADNWATCPRCKAQWEEEARKAEQDVAAKYGNVPIDEFEKARRDLADLLRREIPRTFREDYEFYGASTGEVTADYGGECTECGLTARLKHSVTFYPEEKS